MPETTLYKYAPTPSQTGKAALDPNNQIGVEVDIGRGYTPTLALAPTFFFSDCVPFFFSVVLFTCVTIRGECARHGHAFVHCGSSHTCEAIRIGLTGGI